jgi:hypothetical protein
MGRLINIVSDMGIGGVNLKIFLQFGVVILLLVIILVYVAGNASEKQGNAQAAIMYGRAHIIEVQNEARKDLMAGLMPYTVIGLGVLGTVALTIVALVTILTVSILIFALLFISMNGPGAAREAAVSIRRGRG